LGLGRFGSRLADDSPDRATGNAGFGTLKTYYFAKEDKQLSSFFVKISPTIRQKDKENKNGRETAEPHLAG
ncbi:MAG: hypothetical protein VE99_C0003G0067, partial [candidate division Kazan bacterium GW2011_GWC1_52_13]